MSATGLSNNIDNFESCCETLPVGREVYHPKIERVQGKRVELGGGGKQ
jgi:hypothetical protein